MTARSFRMLALALGLGLALVGCGPAAQDGRTEALTVSGAWVRPPIGPDRPAAGYLAISAAGGEGDVLTAARSPSAAAVEIHETTTGEGGMSGMHAVDAIDVPAGATVALEPGGYHLMLMGVMGELVVGSTVELVLTFEQAGDVTVLAEVREG